MKIETKRTTIRLPKESDREFLKNLWLDGEVMKQMGFPSGYKTSEKEIDDWIKNTDKNKTRLIVEDKFTGELIGETGWQLSTPYPHSKGRKCASLDIKIAKKFWGQGLATEFLTALIKYIFKNTDIDVLFVDPNIENTAAINLYQKIGFKSVGKPVNYTEKVQVPITTQYMEFMK